MPNIGSTLAPRSAKVAYRRFQKDRNNWASVPLSLFAAPGTSETERCPEVSSLALFDTGGFNYFCSDQRLSRRTQDILD